MCENHIVAHRYQTHIMDFFAHCTPEQKERVYSEATKFLNARLKDIISARETTIRETTARETNSIADITVVTTANITIAADITVNTTIGAKTPTDITIGETLANLKQTHILYQHLNSVTITIPMGKVYMDRMSNWQGTIPHPVDDSSANAHAEK